MVVGAAARMDRPGVQQRPDDPQRSAELLPTRTTAMVGANATMRMPSEPPTRPVSIQGRRMPSREVVRSLSLPKNGFPTIASRAPVPVTTAKLLGAVRSPRAS